MKRVFAVLALAGALGGCDPYYYHATPSPPPPAPPVPRHPPMDACGAAQLQYLIGRPASDIPSYGRHEVRVMGQGGFYDDGYRAERLTVIYDEATGRITRVRCG